MRRDQDGYYWVTGRTDDLLNVSGHLLSTAEVESALVEHDAVAETAAVSCNHTIKGEAIYCFIVLKEGVEYSKELDEELKGQGKHLRCRFSKVLTIVINSSFKDRSNRSSRSNSSGIFSAQNEIW